MEQRENNSVKKLLVQFGLILFIAFMLLFTAAEASAQDAVMRRYALFIGSNYGGRDRVTLSYAVTDARTVSEVMQQLGGVMPNDSIILTDPSPSLVNYTMDEIRKSINSDNSKRSEFFFYYSGHSDEKGLLLGDSVMKYEDLKGAIDSVGADVNIAVLDSCSSGAFTRMKGGVRRSPFLSDDSVDASGHAFLTSSSEDEAAQESDDLGASFFTHYFVTALRGAADSTLDGTVSLNEAYSYASSETLARTEETLAGPQHPSYDIQLAGTGDLVLTDLRSISEQIMFEEGLRGRIFVRDSAGRLVVELKKIEGTPLAVSIGPGRYSMILDDGTQLLSADLLLAGGSKVVVMRDEFYPVPRSINQTRGGTHVAADDGRSVDKPSVSSTAVGSQQEKSVDDTAAELDTIAERARRRALEAAGIDPDSQQQAPGRAEPRGQSGSRTEYFKTENGNVSFTPGDPDAPETVPGEGSEKTSPPVDGDSGFSLGIIADAYYLNGIQLGALGANVDGDLNGVQAGGVFTNASGDVKGAQFGGVWSSADGEVTGAQVSGVWNSAGAITGVQLSGVWNSADEVMFAQVAGVFNTSEGPMQGVQSAGVFNIAEDEVVGAQVSGVFNTAGDVMGIQLSSIINIAKDVTGGQIGLLNFGDVVNGVQIGLVNISEEMHGVPIGLINISGDGLNDLSMWYSDNSMVNFGYQLGTSTVYTFMTAGFDDSWTASAYAGLGMGLELSVESVFLDVDLYAKAFQSGQGDAINNIQNIFYGGADIFPAARISAGVEIFDFLSIFAGVNLDCSLQVDYQGYSFDIGEVAAQSYTVSPMSAAFDYGSVNIYPSWFIGVRI